MRVVINAQILPGGGTGGVESALIGLVRALGQLEGDEEYLLVTHPDARDWLTPYLGPHQTVLPAPHAAPRTSTLERAKTALGPLRPGLRTLWRELVRPRAKPLWPTLSTSDGFFEGLDAQVVHFPYQCFVITGKPSIYNPHDLQHLHFPEFFDPAVIALREKVYRTACEVADTVVVCAGWVKEDLLKQYRLTAAKVQVIPFAPPTQAYAAPTEQVCLTVLSEHGLEQPFALYPAILWEHKNHLRLLEAIALLRDRDRLVVRLVCTGELYPRFWPRVEQRLRQLRLENQVRFLGTVGTQELRALYRLSEFVVVPTLFEAASGPVFEAWQEDVPVACSNVTSLPEQAGAAAVVFDPFSVESIAEAVRRLHADADLRQNLVQKGRGRLADFSWERTAKAYRAVYRRAAGLELSDEDRDLLSWDWARDPRRTGRA